MHLCAISFLFNYPYRKKLCFNAVVYLKTDGIEGELFSIWIIFHKTKEKKKEIVYGIQKISYMPKIIKTTCGNTFSIITVFSARIGSFY